MNNDHHILIIDDDQAIRQALGDFLTCVGYKVATANSVGVGLRMMDYQSFDLIISDVSMPGQGGIDLIHILQRRGVDIPVLLMSGNSIINTPAAAFRVGAIGFMRKPVQLRQLQGKVKEVFRDYNVTRVEATAQSIPLMRKQLSQLVDGVIGPLQIVDVSVYNRMRRLPLMCARAYGVNRAICILAGSVDGHDMMSAIAFHAAVAALPDGLGAEHIYQHIKADNKSYTDKIQVVSIDYDAGIVLIRQDPGCAIVHHEMTDEPEIAIIRERSSRVLTHSESALLMMYSDPGCSNHDIERAAHANQLSSPRLWGEAVMNVSVNAPSVTSVGFEGSALSLWLPMSMTDVVNTTSAQAS